VKKIVRGGRPERLNPGFSGQGGEDRASPFWGKKTHWRSRPKEEEICVPKKVATFASPHEKEGRSQRSTIDFTFGKIKHNVGGKRRRRKERLPSWKRKSRAKGTGEEPDATKKESQKGKPNIFEGVDRPKRAGSLEVTVQEKPTKPGRKFSQKETGKKLQQFFRVRDPGVC